MCGIAGIISKSKKNLTKPQLQLMSDALIHRGPDGEGTWINENNNVGFSHTRLSIIDLSVNANQPLIYLHYTIVFNGEIYNYLELKEFLIKNNYQFLTQSDTEVLLAAYDFWGEDCLQQFDGMFAFAIYNTKKNTVFIARDRFGEKPFFYAINNEKDNAFTDFYFASEMKALWAIGIEKNVNNQQILNYISLGYTSNPTNKFETFYSNIYSLPASHKIILDLNTFSLNIKKWYNLEKVESRKDRKSENIITEFSNLFQTSIKKRLRSDVSIGTSLSGGIDSSSIIATIHQLSQKNNYQPKTFTASFPNFEFDETNYSKLVATHFNLEQHFTFPTATNLVEQFKTLMHHQEEPLQSSSVFSQFMVYKLAKENNVSILLDGQGADEILGGYKKYSNWFLQELLRTNLSEFKFEKALLKSNEFLENWNIKNYFAAFLPKITATQLQKKAVQLQNNYQFFNQDFLKQNQNLQSLQKPVIKELKNILHYNTFTFGLDELLRYADRNSMAHSREVRLPFLNHELVEFIFSLPSNFKIKNGFTKWILRDSVKNLLPKEIVWRKGKIGYEPPQKQWMKDKSFQQLIMESRKKLVEHRILNKSILDTQIISTSAQDAENYDWRSMCVAAILL